GDAQGSQQHIALLQGETKTARAKRSADGDAVRMRRDYSVASRLCQGLGPLALESRAATWRGFMFTATADLILPSTTTGSFPRPRWFDVSMWGRPLDTCMLDVRFREKFQDAMAVTISDQERAGLDIL